MWCVLIIQALFMSKILLLGTGQRAGETSKLYDSRPPIRIAMKACYLLHVLPDAVTCDLTGRPDSEDQRANAMSLKQPSARRLQAASNVPDCSRIGIEMH
jgi:hypothetical protein